MALFDLRHSRWAVVAALARTLLLCACEEEKKLDIASKINPAKMATMTTKNVSTLISDSGVVQYKIVSPLWTIYDAVDTPYWEFPKGLYLQKYDPYYYRLDGSMNEPAPMENLIAQYNDGNAFIMRGPAQKGANLWG